MKYLHKQNKYTNSKLKLKIRMRLRIIPNYMLKVKLFNICHHYGLLRDTHSLSGYLWYDY